MRISVVIPTLNEQATIAASLQALYNRPNRPEIIIVDGGSRDATVECSNRWANRVLISPTGRARQMNLGAQQAGGEVLLFLHADTSLPNNAFELIEQAIRNGADWGRFDVRLDGRHWLLPIVAAMMNLRSRWSGIATGDQAVFVTRKTFESVGGFPDIALMEDIALCKILKQHSQPACFTAKVITSARRWEQYGVFRTILLMWLLRLRYCFGANPDDLASQYRSGRLWKR